MLSFIAVPPMDSSGSVGASSRAKVREFRQGEDSGYFMRTVSHARRLREVSETTMPPLRRRIRARRGACSKRARVRRTNVRTILDAADGEQACDLRLRRYPSNIGNSL